MAVQPRSTSERTPAEPPAKAATVPAPPSTTWVVDLNTRRIVRQPAQGDAEPPVS